jgi:hypothetical protein
MKILTNHRHRPVLFSNFHKENQQNLNSRIGKILKSLTVRIFEYSFIYLSSIDQIYEPGPPPAYYPEEYYENQALHKKRGISVRICSLHTNKYQLYLGRN